MALFVCHSAEHHFTEKTFLPEFADGEKAGGKKQLELGFWESLVGTQSFGHCGSVTLTFGHGEGEKRVKSLLFFPAVSYHTNCFATAHNSQRQQSLNPSNHMNMHDKSAFLLCPLSCIFFSTQRPVVLCLIGPDI